MNLNKRFKKLASLITCGAIYAVMLFGGGFSGVFSCVS